MHLLFAQLPLWHWTLSVHALFNGQSVVQAAALGAQQAPASHAFVVHWSLVAQAAPSVPSHFFFVGSQAPSLEHGVAPEPPSAVAAGSQASPRGRAQTPSSSHSPLAQSVAFLQLSPPRRRHLFSLGVQVSLSAQAGTLSLQVFPRPGALRRSRIAVTTTPASKTTAPTTRGISHGGVVPFSAGGLPFGSSTSHATGSETSY